jgi:acid phosphatase type 7
MHPQLMQALSPWSGAAQSQSFPANSLGTTVNGAWIWGFATDSSPKPHTFFTRYLYNATAKRTLGHCLADSQPEYSIMQRFTSFRRLAATAMLSLLCLFAGQAQAQQVVVMPYVQPGDGRFLAGTDVKVITWMTDQKDGDFTVEYQVPFGEVRSVKPVRMALDFDLYKVAPKGEKKAKDEKQEAKKAGDTKKKKDEDEDVDPKEPPIKPAPEMEQHYYKYTAHLEKLPFNSDVHYRVKLGGTVVREASFRTRATADRSTRCVLVGDMAQGREKHQNEIAFRISEQRPDFLMALGDIVYPTGRMNQYMAYFFGTYNNVKNSSPMTGAPLMATVPFYPVLGNHDVSAKLPAVPDAFAAYYVFSGPKGGPGPGPWATGLGKDDAIASKFRAATADSYPFIDAYSFDNGPAHFVILNDNKGMAIDDPSFRAWLRSDLMATNAKWKIVCFHIPPFHSSKQHYPEQQMRKLEPLFEECGVDLTFGGHVHNYQRTLPIKFVPAPTVAKSAQVDGQFTIDKNFDGKLKTKAGGVIHIVAGGGGAHLYGPGIDKTADFLHKTYGENYADFTARLVADEHSFVVLDLSPDRLQLRAIGANGNELDSFILTK